MQVLKDLNSGKYQRTMVSQEKGKWDVYYAMRGPLCSAPISNAFFLNLRCR